MDGASLLIPTDWKYSLELLRDSLGDRYGHIAVLAPTVPADSAAGHSLEPVTMDDDRIELLPSYPLFVRTRDFWLKHYRQCKRDIRNAVARAAVVHASLNNMYQPFSYMAHCEAVRQNKPTVFVRDTDILLQLEANAKGQSLLKRIELGIYGRIVDRAMRNGVKTADLSLLKGSALMNRYAAKAKNARCFQNTSYALTDVIPEEVLLARLDSLVSGERPFQFVYCGRLMARKGVDRTVRIIAGLAGQGHRIDFHILGTGPEEPALRALAKELDIEHAVQFHGHVPYGPGLFGMLYQYDALIFTPQFEDTPRMIFDGYAAALPLFGGDIDYVKERHREEGATVLLPGDDLDGSIHAIAETLGDPAAFRRLALAARKAGEDNTAERWYEKRTQWTHDAVGPLVTL